MGFGSSHLAQMAGSGVAAESPGMACGGLAATDGDCSGRGWRRWLTITASCLMVVGAAGFFGTALSAAGGLNWLPSSFEWPVGYTGGVVSTSQGLHVVPHTPSGRVQEYDANWSFLTGWH